MKTTTMVVITGPMFSGKSEDIIGRLRRAVEGEKRVLVIKPKKDSRTSNEIVSRGRRNGKFEIIERFPAYPIATLDELKAIFKAKDPEVLGIDEAQFFEPWFFEFVFELLRSRRDISIIVSGLDTDAWGRPFGIMPNLMAIADETVKKKAICARCKDEEAIMSQKKTAGSGGQIEVGDFDKYEPRCRKCHTPPEENPA